MGERERWCNGGIDRKEPTENEFKSNKARLLRGPRAKTGRQG